MMIRRGGTVVSQQHKKEGTGGEEGEEGEGKRRG